jgi:hypothetical protein
MCSITNATDEWELAEAVEMVRDGTAKQQLKGIQMITAALKGVPVHPVGVPPLPTSEAEGFDRVRRIWARTFDDLAKEDGDAGGAPGAAPPESEEDVISDLLSFGEVPPPPDRRPCILCNLLRKEFSFLHLQPRILCMRAGRQQTLTSRRSSKITLNPNRRIPKPIAGAHRRNFRDFGGSPRARHHATGCSTPPRGEEQPRMLGLGSRERENSPGTRPSAPF